jgi:hypothetical protein
VIFHNDIDESRVCDEAAERGDFKATSQRRGNYIFRSPARNLPPREVKQYRATSTLEEIQS